MSAAKACSGHFLPKTCLGRKTLRGCTRKKRDNIVLIDVDSDDFGDVIILDVPDSFREKFRKKSKHVISVDDDDEEDNNCESRNRACDQNGDATSDQGFPTKAAHSSNSANADGDAASKGKMPVKLSKSRRTYSDKNVSRNRYGLSSEYNFSSDSDCSDCEFMGDSSGSFRQWWETTCFTQSHDRNCVSPQSKSGTSDPIQPAHDIAEKVIGEESKPFGQQRNSSKCPFNCDIEDAFNDSGLAEGSQFFHQDDPSEISGLFERKRNSSGCYSDPVDNFGSSVPDIPAFQSVKQSAADMSNLSSSRGIFNHEKNRVFDDSAMEVVGEDNGTQQNGDANEMSETLVGANSASIEDYLHIGGESNCPGSDPGKPYILSKDNFCFGHEVHDKGAKSSDDQSCIFTDREKRKETDEYKRAMEEEWASRQKELQRQSEDARRLRSRKKAEKMRIMDNERRQMQRLKEIRETRRNDEENLNRKDKLRAEVKKELRKLETTCGDLSSLLRCLGIHVGGGRYPSLNEIQAAYKRACLKFHPDRFGQCELRQQVESEEKFKLISTMKDKYLS